MKELNRGKLYKLCEEYMMNMNLRRMLRGEGTTDSHLLKNIEDNICFIIDEMKETVNEE